MKRPMFIAKKLPIIAALVFTGCVNSVYEDSSSDLSDAAQMSAGSRSSSTHIGTIGGLNGYKYSHVGNKVIKYTKDASSVHTYELVNNQWSKTDATVNLNGLSGAYPSINPNTVNTGGYYYSFLDDGNRYLFITRKGQEVSHSIRIPEGVTGSYNVLEDPSILPISSYTAFYYGGSRIVGPKILYNDTLRVAGAGESKHYLEGSGEFSKAFMVNGSEIFFVHGDQDTYLSKFSFNFVNNRVTKHYTTKLFAQKTHHALMTATGNKLVLNLGSCIYTVDKEDGNNLRYISYTGYEEDLFMYSRDNGAVNICNENGRLLELTIN